MKVCLQTQDPLHPKYTSLADCVCKTFQEGPTAFYKGTLMPLLGVGACVSIQFGVLEYGKRYFRLKNQGQALSAMQLFTAGAAAGVSNSIISGILCTCACKYP